MNVAPVTFQVLRARLSGVVQEMQFSLFRTGFSTIIRESQDASCAFLDPKGRVVAQHVVLPLHIGAFPACTAAVLRNFGDDLREGDAYLINHTYEGGSPHAPDFFVICPVFVDGELLGFAASMAHKSDIGGPVPGSCSASATEIYNEGITCPPSATSATA
jgi:N-methylhydantoinase B